jgi:T4 gene Gp59 loader of gp41 DNA helicase
MITAYETFQLYNALKLHFNGSYDFFKYNGKSNISVDSFEKRKDKYHFYKLSRKYTNKEEMKNFLIANFVDNDQLWVGDLLGEGAHQNYLRRQKAIQSISYVFENDIKNIFEGVEDKNALMRCKEGDYPPILLKYLRREIQIETLCVLNKIINCIDVWDDCIIETIRWPGIKRKIMKYQPFVSFDEVRLKLKLKEILV